LAKNLSELPWALKRWTVPTRPKDHDSRLRWQSTSPIGVPCDLYSAYFLQDRDKIDNLVRVAEEQKERIESNQSQIKNLLASHKDDMANLNDKVNWLYKKWHLVRASTLDDWSKNIFESGLS
jgi:hypothetical protein